MDAEFDFNLSREQWDVLRALRLPIAARGRTNTNSSVLEQLIALDLASIEDGSPRITPTGRKVLIRGSSSLLDVAA
jgi:hypothetical protein